MRAKYFIGLSINDQLHHCFLIAATQGVFESTKAGTIDVDFSTGIPGLMFSQADSTDIRLTEDRRRYIRIVHGCGLLKKLPSRRPWPRQSPPASAGLGQ